MRFTFLALQLRVRGYRMHTSKYRPDVSTESGPVPVLVGTDVPIFLLGPFCSFSKPICMFCSPVTPADLSSCFMDNFGQFSLTNSPLRLYFLLKQPLKWPLPSHHGRSLDSVNFYHIHGNNYLFLFLPVFIVPCNVQSEHHQGCDHTLHIPPAGA